MYKVTVNWLALAQYLPTLEEAEKWFKVYRDEYPHAMIEIRNYDCPFPYKTSFKKNSEDCYSELYFPPKGN